MQLLFDFPELRMSTPKTLIDCDNVIKDFGITNIESASFKNTRTGRVINYSESNYEWVKSQVDYFNSDFTDEKAWNRFTTIVYKWYYNHGFKKYKEVGNRNLERIHEWAEEAYMAFIQVYRNRIEMIKYFQGQILDAPTDRFSKRILKRNRLDTSEKQFAYLFQSRIGSLKMYVISLKLEEENPHNEVSLDFLMEKTQKIMKDTRYNIYAKIC